MSNNDEDIGKLIAKNLKRLSYEHGKTQADISRDLGISKQTLSTWMNGTRIPRMPKIDLLCHYFNCKRSDILEPHVPLMLVADNEVEIINAFRRCSPERKKCVLLLLGLK